ncbi:unnamed protein product, partial [Discosporangium mesarthrocarpum]
PPHPTPTLRFAPQDIFKRVPHLDPCGVDLLRQILVFDPSQRPSCGKALRHPYFDTTDPETVN